jgi:excinuclease ABC subunit C
VNCLEKLKEKVKFMPNGPGCYLMYDKNNTIIYIGKAKNLKNRVRSYFSGAHNLKTTKLISEIVDFSFVQTKTELEALLLEVNLIKKHLPKYNIKLTDDASYPYIVITEEEHPRIIVSRDLEKDKGLYFGPYPNVYSARETVKLLNRMYPFRKCEFLPKRACLYYHMGECLAPCIENEPIDYTPYIKQVTAFLKGDTKNVIEKLKMMMNQAAEKLQYERALEYKKLIESVEQTTEKQLISLNDFKDRDFIAYKANREDISLQILLMRKGKIIDAKSEIIPRFINPNDQIVSYLLQYYDKRPIPDEICLDAKFDLAEIKEVFGNKAIIPKIGDKKKLVDLAYKNAAYDLKHHELLSKETEVKKEKTLNAFKQLLNLENINRIDAFDNAHLFGANPISAMVVYESGRPAKKEYRKYHLKSTLKADDYGAFKEVLYRRYQRVLLERLKQPDLIIVDGGKGQVNASIETLNSLGLKIPVVGLKKNIKHQLESVVYNNNEFQLEKGRELYTYLSSISEEMHRFALDFHQKSRKRSLFVSPLDNIKGVGPVRKKKILQKFITKEKMIKGTIKDYQSIGISESLRQQIIKHLKESVIDEKNNKKS